MLSFPEIRVGDVIEHEALAVFPLYSPPNGSAAYLLSDEALATGSVTVAETRPGPSPRWPSPMRLTRRFSSSKGRSFGEPSRTVC
jgi:hypothetical protein